MSFTMYGREILLRAIFTPDAVTLPTSLQVALTTSVPPANASMDQLVEPTAAEYARQTYAVNAASWAPTGFGDLYNAIKITYPQVVDSWGLLVGWALVDPVAAQCLNAGPLLEPIATIAGMVPYVDPGSIVLGIAD